MTTTNFLGVRIFRKFTVRPDIFLLSGSRESLPYFFQNHNKNKSAFTQFYFYFSLRPHFCVKNEIKWQFGYKNSTEETIVKLIQFGITINLMCKIRPMWQSRNRNVYLTPFIQSKTAPYIMFSFSVTFRVGHESWLVKNREGNLWTFAHDKKII